MAHASDNPIQLELDEKIAAARALAQRPHAERFVEPASLGELLPLQAEWRGEALYLRYYQEQDKFRSWTYRSFYMQVRRVAAVFRDELKLKRGDRICLAMHNHDAAICCNFAAWYLGLTTVPLNMSEDDKRLQYVLEHSEAKAIVVLDEYCARMNALLSKVPVIDRRMAVTDTVQPGYFSYYERCEAVSEASVRNLESDCAPEDEATIVYTSGTTGVPKGVVLTQYNLLVDAYAIAQWHALSPDKRMLCVLPVHHVNGLVVTHVTPFFAGASVVLLQKFATTQFFEIVRKERVYLASVVPTLLHFLNDGIASFDRAAHDSLSHIICGAGPLTVDLASRFEDKFRIPIIHGYGLSESTCYSCFLPAPGSPGFVEHTRWMRDYGYPSIGIPVPVNEMAIHDENGNTMPEGTKGEIVIRGHNIMKGYYNNPKANRDAFTHGWFRSGDEGFWHRDKHGNPHFFISGRFKELIVRGGVKISPLEVDEVLNRIPGVKAGMAVGFENAAYGEEVGAYIVPLPGAALTEEFILAQVAEMLAPHAVPKVVVFGETFPVTSTGKYRRNELKPLFARWRETQFKSKR